MAHRDSRRPMAHRYDCVKTFVMRVKDSLLLNPTRMERESSSTSRSIARGAAAGFGGYSPMNRAIDDAQARPL